MLNQRELKWYEKWIKMRKYGRIQFSIIKSFYISTLIAVVGYLFVYLTKYPLKTSYFEFALILFLVMFIYKFVKHYFVDWPRNEKLCNEWNKD